jgi:RNA polymerase-binding transcription factor DksA
MPRATKDAPVKSAATKASSKSAKSGGKATKAARSRGKAASKGKKATLDKFLEGQLALLEEDKASYLRQAETLQAEADSLTEDREPGDVQFDEEYGECENCGTKIPKERLKALPYASLCVKCKSGGLGLR